MDGGKKWKRILYVTLPNIKSSITICLFNTLIGYLALYGQPYTLSDIKNKDTMVSPMMWIQHFISDEGGMPEITGMVCAAAIIFGIISMIIGEIQRKAMDGVRHSGRYEASCKNYFENKKLLSAVTGAVVETPEMSGEVDYE